MGSCRHTYWRLEELHLHERASFAMSGEKQQAYSEDNDSDDDDAADDVEDDD